MSIFERKIKVSAGLDSPLMKAFDWPKVDYYHNMAEKAILHRRDYIKMPKSDYDEMMSFVNAVKERDRLITETARLNNEGIALENEGRIDEAIRVYEENITLGYPARHSYDRLLVLYHKCNRTDDEKRIAILACEMFPNENKYAKRLQVITNQYQETLPTEAHIQKNSTPTIGKRYWDAVKNVKEFDFYSQLKDGESTLSWLDSHPELMNQKALKNVTEYRKMFDEMANEAQSHEDNGRLDLAADVYEKMIAEECFLVKPYERLIAIYHKAKLKFDERRVLSDAVIHLTSIEVRQKDYVLGLAEKYGKLDFANNYISNGKRIQYYMGIFDLYNPYNIISKWKIRLEKLNKQLS